MNFAQIIKFVFTFLTEHEADTVKVISVFADVLNRNPALSDDLVKIFTSFQKPAA